MPAPPPIVRSLEDLTPAALARFLAQPGRAAPRIAAVMAERIGAGRGYRGTVARLSVVYDGPEPGLPERMIVKLAAPHPGGFEVGRAFGLYAREAAFYRNLAASGATMPAPSCLTAHADLGRDEFLLILEDLSGLEACDQLDGLDVPAARAVLAALGRQHAAFWGGESLESHAFWLPRIDDEVFRSASGLFAACWPVYRERAGHRLSPAVIAAGDRLAGGLGYLFDRLAASAPTLVHGDFRADNLFLGPGGPRVVDWQWCSRGPGAFDVAYLLATSIESAVLAREGRRLVEVWAGALGAVRPGPEALARALAAGLDFSLVYLAIGAVASDLTDPRATRLVDQGAERLSAAVEALS